MNRRLILGFLAFGVILALFLFVDERKENLSETIFWKESWSTLEYTPPSEEWLKNNDSFAKNSIRMQIYSTSWKDNPIFSASTKDDATKEEFIYEGNFNVKNSFNDLSVLKTKIWEVSTPEVLKTYSIDPANSPKIKLTNKNGSSKDLVIGKKLTSDTNRIVCESDSKVIAPYYYILEKFKNPIESLRERQFINHSGGYVKSIAFSSLGRTVKAENSADKNQFGSYVNHWRRPLGGRIVLPPEIGNQWESQVKALRADLYPDDTNGPGFAFAKESSLTEPEAEIQVELSSGVSVSLKIFPVINWKDRYYRPIIREFKGFFIEGPSFMSVESFGSFLNGATQVQNAKQWERPNQRIQ